MAALLPASVAVGESVPQWGWEGGDLEISARGARAAHAVAPFLELDGGQRPTDKEPLHQVAAHEAQALHDVARLDTLGHHP